jgi:hypothetical protein
LRFFKESAKLNAPRFEQPKNLGRFLFLTFYNKIAITFASKSTKVKTPQNLEYYELIDWALPSTAIIFSVSPIF